MELPRIVFPMTILPMGVHVNFVQEVPPDGQCWPRIFVVEDVCMHLDTLTLDFVYEFGASSIFTPFRASASSFVSSVG